MAGSAHHVLDDLMRRGQAFWLPPGGWGNRLPDTACSWTSTVSSGST